MKVRAANAGSWPAADSVNVMLWKAEAVLRAQCLSNPPPCWEDRSVRGGVLCHRKRLAKRETRYKICKLALSRHMLHTHTHTFRTAHPHVRACAHTRTHTVDVSLLASVSSSSQLLFPNDQQDLRKCDSYPICGQRMIFSCCKSFTRLSRHARPQRCQQRKPQTSSEHRGQM